MGEPSRWNRGVAIANFFDIAAFGTKTMIDAYSNFKKTHTDL